MALSASLSAVCGADAVTFEYRVVATDEAVTLQFTSGQRSDIVVTDAGGTVVWRASEGRAYTLVTGTETVTPDDPLVYTDRMPRPPAGDYEAVATLAATGVDVPATTAVEIR